MKRLLALALSVLMLLTCAPVFAAVTDGTYEVTSTGNAEGLNLAVTFTGGAISGIDVLSHNETPGICEIAFERVPAAIIAANSVAVDAVSGATNTSNGIISGVKAAIEAAGGSVDEFMAANAAGDAELTARTIECDVVVAGAGIAGLSAAITAAEAGANVVLLEKNAQVGGSLALAGGNFVSVDSAVGASYGIDDNKADTVTFWNWSTEHSYNKDTGYPDMPRVERMMDEIDGLLTWMLDHGVPYERGTDVGPQTVAKIYTTGRGAAVAQSLEAAALKAGVTLLKETPATALIAENGAVVGIEAQSSTEALTIRAQNVLLATGGFGANPDLVAEWVPSYAGAMSSVASGNTGDGFLMAQAVGAAFYNDPWVMPAGLTLDPSISGALSDASVFSYSALANRALVNTSGVRFTNEFIGGAYAILTNAVAMERCDVWYILDGADEANAAMLEEGAEKGVIAKADTLAELAGAIGVSADSLAKTVEDYNAACVAGADGAFEKDPAYLLAYAAEGPYYAVKFIPALLGTIAGVVTDEAGRVYDEAGQVIPGLYAAGEMSNRAFYNQVYVGAASLSLYPIASQAAVADMLAK